jgi:hypothetical protein
MDNIITKVPLEGLMAARGTKLRSFRLDARVNEMLSIAARKRRETKSAYLSKALLRELRIDLLSPASDGIFLDKDALQELLKTNELNRIEQAGSAISRSHASMAFEILNIPRTRDSVAKFLTDIVGESWRWFRLDLETSGRITIYHEYGANWSQFLRAYLIGLFHQLNESEVSVDIIQKVIRIRIA